MIGKFATEAFKASFFSKHSPPVAGLNCELKDLLNRDDNVGSGCLDVGAAPAKAAGWKDRFGICLATRERT